MPTDALVSQSISSLIGGVSQQPATIRSTNQAEEQINCVSDVAKGVRRRPPTEHLALLTGSAAGGAPSEGYFVHPIDLGVGKQFVALIEDGDINVFDITDGTEKTVNDNAAGAPGTYTYLDEATAGLGAQATFEAVTVADYTVVLNKTITPAMSGSPSTGRSNEFLLVIKQLPGINAASNSVDLVIDGTSYNGAHVNDSGVLIDNLMTALTGGTTGVDVAGLVAADDWEFSRYGANVLYGVQVSSAGGGPLGALEAVTSSDHFGDAVHVMAATSVSGSSVTEEASVQRFSDLPEKGRDGFVVKISGDDGNEDDDYYVKYDLSENIWKETVVAGIDDTFDADTMPHVLIYDQTTDQFSFEPATWLDRLVGDTGSAPEPSFIGNPIKDVTVHKDRLIFVADENAIAGEAGNLFNFWPTTITTLVDSDPFDVAATGNRVATIDYAIPFRGNVSLFSETGDMQSELLGSRDDVLSVKNARIEERGAYALSDTRPVASGEAIYFVLDRSNRSGVFTYRESDVGVFRATEITSHVDDYLPGGIFKIAAGRAENMLVCLATSATNSAYVYRFRILGNEQVMSSWSIWEFDTDVTILSTDWIGSKLYFVMERQDGTHIEVMDFGKSFEDTTGGTPLLHRVHLDSLVKVTGTYSVIFDETTWTLPYDQATNGGTYHIVTSGDWGNARGRLVAVKDATTDLTITATGDHSASPVYIGREYESSYELSEIFFRSTTRSGESSLIDGRLQLRRGNVVYEDTGTFEVAITSREPGDTDEYFTIYTSQFINQAVFGPVALESGTFEFDIGANSRDAEITFRSSSFLPFILTSLSWQGRYYQRSTQV